eukprot:scaffold12369_cov97-Cylindrotheca_fusiformis.AAC.9
MHKCERFFTHVGSDELSKVDETNAIASSGVWLRDESGAPELGTKSVTFSPGEPHDPKSDLHDPKGQGITPG